MQGTLRDMGSVSGSGRSPGEVHSNPPQCSCLENPTKKHGGLQSIGSQRDNSQLKRLSVHRSLSYTTITTTYVSISNTCILHMFKLYTILSYGIYHSATLLLKVGFEIYVHTALFHSF